jgi:phage terminase large subunit
MVTTRVFNETLAAYLSGARIIANKGGTRSTKTFTNLQLLRLIQNFSKRRRIITVVSHSLPHLESGAIRDFENILIEDGVNIDSVRTKKPYLYNINRSLIEFVGFDRPNKALGAARDCLLINEANKMPFAVCNQLMIRTTELILLDWNPSEDYWFDTEKFSERPDCKVINSTFYDNVNIKTGTWNLSPGQLEEFKIAKRKAAEEDKRGRRGYWWNWWQVYGLGRRGQLEGVIFQNWRLYDQLPEGKLFRLWVIDWGGYDPTTISELNFSGHELYIKEHIYQPQVLNSKLIAYLQDNMKHGDICICDSARKDKIYELQMAGITAMGATKGAGSVIDGLDLMQEFDIYIHKDSMNAQSEFEKYKRIKDETTGKYLDQPEDANNHCFIGSTLIETDRGLKPIKSIDENDFVFTSFGFRQVLKKFDNGLKQVNKYLIQFDIFSLSLSCTDDHLINTDKGWIKISELKSGTTVYLSKNLTEKYISYIQKNDIFRGGQKECTSKFGSSIMDQLKKVIMFIIKIQTRGITFRKILNLKKNQNIRLNTEKREQKTILNGLKILIQKAVKLLKNGISQKKGLNGTKNKGLAHGKIVNLKHLFVSNVGKNTRQGIQEFQNFVEITVKHVHCENVGEMNVYDLMIKDQHEYFANGILVHNCIDPTRYGVRYYKKFVKPT